MIKSKFWLFAFLVLLLMAGNFFYTSRHVVEDARAQADARLSRAEHELVASEAAAMDAAMERVRRAAALPVVTDAVKAAARAQQPPTAAAFEAVRTALAESATQAGRTPHGLLVLATGRGAGRFLPGEKPEVGESVPDVPVLTAALVGEAGASLYSTGAGALLRVAAAPILVDGQPAGALLLGDPVDDARAKAVADLTGTGVTYILGDQAVAASGGAGAGLAARAAKAAPEKAFGVGKATEPYVTYAAPVVGFEPVGGYAVKVALPGVDGAAAVLDTSVRTQMKALDQYLQYEMAAVALFLFVALVWSFFVAQGGYGTPKLMVKDLQRAADGDLKVRLDGARYPRPFRKLASTINQVLDQVERKLNPGLADQVLAPKNADLSQVLGGQPPAPEADGPEEGFFFGGDAPAPAAAPEPAFQAPPVSAAEPSSGGFDPFADEPAPEPEPQQTWAPEPEPEPAPAEAADGGGFFSDATRVVSLNDMESVRAQAEAAASSPPRDEADPFAAAMAEEGDEDYNPDATVVAKVPDALLQATARAVGGGAAGRDPDEAHFREVFRDFVATRQKCGEPADGLTFDKFAAKLKKNRDAIKGKHGARSVRFQVYVKEGKAALKATPIK